MVAFGVFIKLPYTTSWLVRAPTESALEVPASSVQVGPLKWDYELYKVAPSLDGFRAAFVPTCGALRGVEAARCVALILDKSPVGDPPTEFVDAKYDPAQALAAHLAGGKGHCTARSALGATALLAMGIPARVVQLLPAHGRGHNVYEVYDATSGWVMYDPLFTSSYLADGDFASAVEVSEASDTSLKWRRPNDAAPDPNLFAGSTISFPEPWLYTRVGDRCAQWPFRGCFVNIGPQQFRYGPAQQLSFGTTLISFAFALVWSAWWLYRRTA